jgi:hypothetical protein
MTILAVIKGGNPWGTENVEEWELSLGEVFNRKQLSDNRELFEFVTARMLHKDPTQRPSMEDVAAMLERAASDAAAAASSTSSSAAAASRR